MRIRGLRDEDLRVRALGFKSLGQYLGYKHNLHWAIITLNLQLNASLQRMPRKWKAIAGHVGTRDVPCANSTTPFSLGFRV